MRRLLVTGGAGFIGSNFIRYWIARHPDDRVVNLDALTYAGNPENLADIEAAPGYRFEHGDITDAVCVAGVFADEAIDTVVNFAAESHVDRSILGPRPSSEPMSRARSPCWRPPGKPGGIFQRASASCTSPPTRSTAA